MPEATKGVATYKPAPVEDDQLLGAHDDIGLGTEVDVDLEIEYEDLNVDSNTWDVRTDSPEPHSPKDADALDCCILGIEPPADASFDVLREVPSTQPQMPPRAAGMSSRQMCARSRKRGTARPLPASTSSTAMVPPTPAASLPLTTGSEHNYSVGRGILHLRAPPSLEGLLLPGDGHRCVPTFPSRSGLYVCLLRHRYSTGQRPLRA